MYTDGESEMLNKISHTICSSSLPERMPVLSDRGSAVWSFRQTLPPFQAARTCCVNLDCNKRTDLSVFLRSLETTCKSYFYEILRNKLNMHKDVEAICF